MKRELDTADRKIVELLQEDARLPQIGRAHV